MHAAQVYLITELLTGGELLDAVLQRGSYNEADARNCFVQLLRGIEYLHAKCVAPLRTAPSSLTSIFREGHFHVRTGLHSMHECLQVRIQMNRKATGCGKLWSRC